MKKANFIAAIAALALLATTAPASALTVGLDADMNVQAESNRGRGSDDDKNDDRRDGDIRKDDHSDRWKSWMFNAGITGTVTAESNDEITVRAKNGATYTVDIDDAKIRYAVSGDSSIDVGDTVFVQGVINGSNIVATVVIDADNQTEPKPSDDERREGIIGTVTAKSGTTLTVLGKNGTTYTVAAADAKVWKNKTETTSFSSIAVGDSVVIQGSVSGSSVTAAKIHAVTLPKENNDGDIRGTVTAKSGTTITILASDGSTYTVDADEADVNDRNNKDADLGDIKVGESIVVDGDVSGSTIDADVITETKTNVGFFTRVGNFFKHLFGKNN